MSKRLLSTVLVVLYSGRAFPSASPANESAPEYAIKAVFLYNLLKYVDWPKGSPLSDSTKPMILAIIGEDPFGSTLDESVRDRTIRGRPVVVIRVPDLKNTQPVHAAFISASESWRAGNLVRNLAERSVLTVGDSQATARAGVAINFVMLQGKVRFDVNQATARRSGVELSSHFLKLARHISAMEG